MFTVAKPQNIETRSKAESIIRTTVRNHSRAGRRVLLGFDFPLSYPKSAIARLFNRRSADWRELWKHLVREVEDARDNTNNRFDVAGRLNRKLGEHVYWGCPRATAGEWLIPTKGTFRRTREFRLVEEQLRRAGSRPFSVWQLLGSGSVGGQSLLGIPICDRLRADESLSFRVWPFETGLVTPTRRAHGNILAEVWPSVIERRNDLHAIKDAAQVLSLVQWAARQDAANALDSWFTPAGIDHGDRDDVERCEGWILGFRG